MDCSAARKYTSLTPRLYQMPTAMMAAKVKRRSPMMEMESVFPSQPRL